LPEICVRISQQQATLIFWPCFTKVLGFHREVEKAGNIYQLL